MTHSIRGFCPFGCGPTLSVEGIEVRCMSKGCPRPLAATDLLLIRETDHVVHFTANGWRLLHPLRCRLGHPDLDCDENNWLAEGSAPARSPGAYRMTFDADGHPDFEAVDAERHHCMICGMDDRSVPSCPRCWPLNQRSGEGDDMRAP